MTINYTEELKRIEDFVPSEGSEYWSPNGGTYTVRSLGELTEAEPFPDDQDKKPRAKLQIQVDGKELTWGMGVGKTKGSTYGQLIHLATQKGGQLLDVEFKVVVTAQSPQDRNKRFTIVL